MVDREARAEMGRVLRAYMAEEVMAFELDERLGKIKTDDRTAREVRFWLWFYYDDVKDHYVVATREAWQYFNRLLLVLESEGELTGERWWVWHWEQAVAVGALVVFGVLLWAGYGVWFYWLWVGMGPVAAFLWARRGERRREMAGPEELRRAPFGSFGALRYWRRRVPGFRRVAYRKEVGERRIRGEGWRVYTVVSTLFLAALVGVLVVVFMVWPMRAGERRVWEEGQ